MLVTKTENYVNKFQTTLQYLVEYSGVKGAVIFDSDGLVVEHLNKDGLDPEQLSPLALLIIDQTSQVLSRIEEPAVNSMVLKSNDSWITIERVNNLVLLVRANTATDDLLRVRIGQSVDMIKAFLKERYPLLAN